MFRILKFRVSNVRVSSCCCFLNTEIKCSRFRTFRFSGSQYYEIRISDVPKSYFRISGFKCSRIRKFETLFLERVLISRIRNSKILSKFRDIFEKDVLKVTCLSLFVYVTFQNYDVKYLWGGPFYLFCSMYLSELRFDYTPREHVTACSS